MRRSDWKNQAGGEWSSMREVPYQQQKFFQKKPNRLQYGPYQESPPLYGRWNAAAQDSEYATPIFAADGSGYYRRYSVDASPESIIYYNSKISGTFIGQPLDNDECCPPSIAGSNILLYPHSLNSADERSPDNVRGAAFYFKQKSTQSAASAADANIINTEQVVHNLTLFGRFLEVVQSWPLPHVSFTTACILVLLATFISPRLWAENVIFPAFRLSFGTLYPAYASYKAVRTKNVKEYVKWMMYWIVYAFFTCIETFTDIFLSWFPFYYEVKVIIVLWLLSPATKGSSTLYRKFVHPMLTRREQEIDEYLNQAKERGYSAVLQLGTKGVNYATNVIMQTALKGGGNLVQTIRRSYSLSDLSEPDVHRTQDEIDDVVQMRPQQRMLRPRTQAGIARSASGTRHSTGMYFSEVDVAKGADGFNYNIRSSEDISSGYSSAEPVSAALSRTSSMTNATKTRLKARRTENLNEPKQYRQLEQNFFAQSPLLAPGGGFGSLENEFLLESSENLQNPTLFDVQQCIHILENTSHVAFQDKVDEDFAETKRPNEKMLPIEENNDMESSRILKNVDNLKDFGGGIQSAEQPPYSDHLEQQQDKEEEATISTNEPAAAIHEVPLPDEISFKDNNSICSNTDTYNTLESSDEDNESDWFSDALPSLAEDETFEDLEEQQLEKQQEENITVQEEHTTACMQEKTPIDPIETQLTDTDASTPIQLDSNKSEKPKVSAKELQDTLKEIKDNFRATIATTTAPTITPGTSSSRSSNKLLTIRPLTHNKGKAPAPPVPPRPTRPATISGKAISNIASLSNTLDSTSISSRSSSPVPQRSIFRNLKTNLFRFTSNSSLSDKQGDGNVEKPTRDTPPYETQI
ncbi:PREDICTED: uncharacterized protein LOC108359284 isoform X2 [Rhagoletis zephyria]|uniref:uncharacterized protein LOC108359284 isoform X2 n=1 Tax=Rhagoletis zephyria TaxID=28612 RepID=UPI0008115C7D|nr:PREDICTED: uncharacterized protein LOC108359284 isoform X2 [Rhagoletis zephyria]